MDRFLIDVTIANLLGWVFFDTPTPSEVRSMISFFLIFG
jgi:hypothetical protein